MIGPRIRTTVATLLLAFSGLLLVGWCGSDDACVSSAPAATKRAVAMPTGLDAFFGRVIDAMGRGDAEAYRRCFDTDGMLGLVLEAADFGPIEARRRRQMAAAFGSSLGQTVHQYRDGLEWADFDVHHVEHLQDGGLVVTARATNRLGLIVKSRWWLTRHDEGWIARDVEDLDLGYRVSAAMGIIVATAGKGPQPWIENVRTLNTVPALLVAGQVAEAEAILTGMADTGLPAPFEAMRLMLLASSRGGRQDYAQAAMDIEAAAALNADMPILDYLRATVFNGLGDHAAALEAGKRYVARVGGDAETSLEIGRAMVGLGKYDEAVTALREGIAYSADCVDCLYELIAISGGASIVDLRAALPAMSDPLDATDAIAATLLAEGHLAAAEGVLDAYSDYAPDDHRLILHRADLRIRQQRHEEAADLLRGEIVRSGGDPSLQAALTDALLAAGQPLEAYREGGAGIDAFVQVGEELVRRDAAARLDELIETHQATHPTDPWIGWFVGRRHEMARDYSGAAAMYHEGMARSQGTPLGGLYREALIAARFHAGAPIEAIASIGPWRETARQLANICTTEEDADRLRELASVCAEDSRSIDLGHLFAAEAHFVEGEHAEVVDVLTTHAAAITAEPASIARFDDRLVRSLVRLGRHGAALRAAQASTARDADPYYEVLVHAAAGAIDEATATFEHCMRLGYAPDAFFGDPDASALLNDAGFAELTQRYPVVTQAGDDRPE